MKYGINLVRGMENEELRKFIYRSIMPVYPNIEDKKWKRVLIKVDIGPGQLKGDFNLQLSRYCLYPWVPSTTSFT